jgi:hypothetical protein
VRNAALLGLMSATLITLVACDGGTIVNGMPTAPTPAQGQITVQSIVPQSGATLTEHQCQSPGSGLTYNCSVDWRMMSDVLYGSNASSVLVVARFYSGSRMCAQASSKTTSIRANTPMSFETTGTPIDLYDDDGQLLCPLPAETDRLEVLFWEVTYTRPLLTRELAINYRFE